jgi:hypothetical protein
MSLCLVSWRLINILKIAKGLNGLKTHQKFEILVSSIKVDGLTQTL